MKIHPAAHICAVIGLGAVFFVSCGGGYRESEAGSATLTVDAAAIAALWIGDGCCIESESFQVTGLTSDNGDFQFLLPGSHYVGKDGKAMAAFTTCDSCLAGKAGIDLRDFKLLRITQQALERPSGVAALQGIYTTDLGTGYTLTIIVDTSGLVTGTDTNGCSLRGQIKDYDLTLDVSACGDSNGRFDGKAALVPGSAERAAELFLSASNADAAIGWRLTR